MYLKRINEGMSINEELYYLEKNLLKYVTKSAEINIAMITGISLSLIGSVIGASLNGLSGSMLLGGTLAIVVLVIIWTYFTFARPLRTESIESQYYNMCLKVLEEIKNEMKEDKLDKLLEFYGINKN
ncbi:hypothetical protein [Clostridium sp. 'White wine YQ']|uniref:hypothetical protein n=1 Tax=Clostridium sp. 'White wine YQ' TaxID=3027474 RepID=UPI0023652E6D|nr:hypothetical protein [Clostridium sp. 'White wine YQ']MDD7793709.1 hypothetical protein [Clostridium sp. 'White wine YQ']